MNAFAFFHPFFLIFQLFLEGFGLLLIFLDEFFYLLFVKIFNFHKTIFLLLGLEKLLLQCLNLSILFYYLLN